MTILKKLDTFTLRDQFSWDRQKVLAEANRVAVRHAEMMCWAGVEVKDITETPAKDGQYICYQFEIWGIGTPNMQDGHETAPQGGLPQPPSQAAKQPEL